MKLLASIIAIITTSMSVGAQQLVVADQSGHQPIAIEADPSSGLSSIIVAAGGNGAMVATFSSPIASASVAASTWSSAGAAHAIAATTVRSGNQWQLTLNPGDTGVTFDVAGDRQYHYWIVDYSTHRLNLQSLSLDPMESDCSTATLLLNGNASPIYYYNINGARRTLSRQLQLTFSTLAFNQSTGTYATDHRTSVLDQATGSLHVEQPLCTTAFVLTGDRFLRSWGEEQSIESPYYEPIAVEATVEATDLGGEAPDNLANSGQSDGSTLGGSAPVEIEFSAEVTDAVRFTEWQISADPNFNIVDYRFNQPMVTHTFTDYGTLYARFVAANNSGDCQYESQVFTISVGASKLLCPNAFSPGDENGVNDEWKVTYQSLVEFECDIFNRWGVHIIKLTDPSQGWDGRHGGKLVPSGVYYYVIRAKGADGVDYKLGGDINVINYSIKPGIATPTD